MGYRHCSVYEFPSANLYFSLSTPAFAGTYVSICRESRPVLSAVRQSVADILTIVYFSAVRHIGWHTFSFEWLQLSFCRLHLASYVTRCPFNACRSINEMVSGYLVPSFPSSVTELDSVESLFFPAILRLCQNKSRPHVLHETMPKAGVFSLR
jgi:hypothetical protein